MARIQGTSIDWRRLSARCTGGLASNSSAPAAATGPGCPATRVRESPGTESEPLPLQVRGIAQKLGGQGVAGHGAADERHRGATRLQTATIGSVGQTEPVA